MVVYPFCATLLYCSALVPYLFCASFYAVLRLCPALSGPVRIRSRRQWSISITVVLVVTSPSTTGTTKM